MNARQKGQKLMATLAAKNHLGLTDAVPVEEAVAKIKASDKAKAAAKPKALRSQHIASKVKAEKGDKLCLCGCGTATKSRFAMGHDSKLKSRLINAVLDGKGNGAAKKAEAEIKSLGWVAFLDKSRGSRDRKAAAKAAAKSKEPIA
jgi:hypothetical protein